MRGHERDLKEKKSPERKEARVAIWPAGVKRLPRRVKVGQRRYWRLKG